MYNKHNIAIGKVASKTSFKPELACIAFYGNRTVATDSFRLIEMSADGRKQKEPTLLFAKEVMERIKLKNEELDIKDIQATARLDSIKATYPSIDVVLDSAEKDIEQVIRVNAVYLAECAMILSKLSKFATVELHIPKNQGKALVLKASNDKQSARALIMPCIK